MTQSLRISIVTIIFASISGSIAPDEKNGKAVWASAHQPQKGIRFAIVTEGQFDGAEGLDEPLQRHHNRKILRWDSGR